MVLLKDKEGKWVLMTRDELTDRMVNATQDIDKTVAESRKGFAKGVKRSLKSLGTEEQINLVFNETGSGC